MIVCAHCRKRATHLAYARGGYADGPRPLCFGCYAHDAYFLARFAAQPIPWVKQPRWVEEWRML